MLALSLTPWVAPLAQTASVPMTAPAGAEQLDAQWTEVTAPTLGKLTFAIARPAGAGPFPTVIVLHGTHGFAREYVQIATALARKGVLAIAACWFSGGGGAGARFVTPIGCPAAPPMTAAASSTTFATVDAIVRTVRALPDVDPKSMTLFGHSRGGGAALNYILRGGQVAGVVLENAGYADDQLGMIPRAAASVLILHGAGNTSADGGSEFNTPDRARRFETALRGAGKQVSAVYYEGAGHSGLFANAAQLDAEISATAAFVQQLGR